MFGVCALRICIGLVCCRVCADVCEWNILCSFQMRCMGRNRSQFSEMGVHGAHIFAWKHKKFISNYLYYYVREAFVCIMHHIYMQSKTQISFNPFFSHFSVGNSLGPSNWHIGQHEWRNRKLETACRLVFYAKNRKHGEVVRSAKNTGVFLCMNWRKKKWGKQTKRSVYLFLLIPNAPFSNALHAHCRVPNLGQPKHSCCCCALHTKTNIRATKTTNDRCKNNKNEIDLFILTARNLLPSSNGNYAMGRHIKCIKIFNAYEMKLFSLYSNKPKQQ